MAAGPDGRDAEPRSGDRTSDARPSTCDRPDCGQHHRVTISVKVIRQHVDCYWSPTSSYRCVWLQCWWKIGAIDLAQTTCLIRAKNDGFALGLIVVAVLPGRCVAKQLAINTDDRCLLTELVEFNELTLVCREPESGARVIDQQRSIDRALHEGATRSLSALSLRPAVLAHRGE